MEINEGTIYAGSKLNERTGPRFNMIHEFYINVHLCKNFDNIYTVDKCKLLIHRAIFFNNNII